MSTTSHESTEKRVKHARTPDVQTGDAKNAKQDKERSDWEGMTPKPEQGEDDIAAPGQLPETD